MESSVNQEAKTERRLRGVYRNMCHAISSYSGAVYIYMTLAVDDTDYMRLYPAVVHLLQAVDNNNNNKILYSGTTKIK